MNLRQKPNHNLLTTERKHVVLKVTSPIIVIVIEVVFQLKGGNNQSAVK